MIKNSAILLKVDTKQIENWGCWELLNSFGQTEQVILRNQLVKQLNSKQWSTEADSNLFEISFNYDVAEYF